MKFVALLSGGKDSCYNIMKCMENGHELLALANLMPPLSAGEELNSWMYQSAAHNVIPNIAKCLNAPLIRKVITGLAVVQSLDYEQNNNDQDKYNSVDEVEDLYVLLTMVIQQYPDIKGVSCGTIVSTYQRLRVENVCNRLGLTPLTYLWHMDRSILLNEMIEAGIYAILVKVAGAGLEPSKHLGKDLSTLYPTLQRLHDRYGLDICGEGGEYESIVLDCPAFINGRINIINSDIIYDEEDISVGNLRVLDCEVIEKIQNIEQIDNNNNNNNNKITWKYENLSLKFQKDLLKLLNTCHNSFNNNNNNIIITNNDDFDLSKTNIANQICLFRNINVAYSTTMLIPFSLYVTINDNNNNVNEIIHLQLHNIMSDLSIILQSYGSELLDIVFIHLYISNMDLFTIVNDEYCKWFSRNPPSRSCIAIPLPKGIYVALDAKILEKSHRTIQLGRSTTRQVLHVRSISEWAPMCIGPYSQANVINNEIIYVAGQIHLDPCTMKLWSPLQDLSLGIYNNYSIYQQLSICFRHVHKILLTLNSELKNCISCIVYFNASIIDKNWNDWENIIYISNNIIRNNCYEKTIDNNINNAFGNRCIDTYSDSSDENSDSDEFTPLLTTIYAINIIGVQGLPRNALVEVEIVSITNNKYELLNFNSIEINKKIENKDINKEINIQLNNLISYNFITNSVCNGRNEIIINNNNNNNNNNNEIEVNIDDIFELLWNGIKQILSNIDMSIIDLQFMKIFYNNDVINRDIMAISCYKILDIVFNISNLNVIFIPIVRLKDNCIITTLFNFSSNQDNV